MNAHVRSVVEACARGSDDNSLTFPQQLGMMAEVGVEGYYADLRRSGRTYYLQNGETIDVDSSRIDTPVAEQFDAALVEAAVREAQKGGPAYTYKDFCKKIMAAGCPGYLVSILGRRVVYFGRTAETHVEHFPAAR